MEVLLACVIGFLLGSVSVLLTVFLLYDKMQLRSEDTEAEARADPEEKMDSEQTTIEEKRWLEEMAALIAYDGRGGAVNGDKENA